MLSSPATPRLSRTPSTQEAMTQMYTTHPSLRMESPERFTFPSPPRHTSVRRVSTPDHRLKPEEDSPSAMHLFSSQRRASTPDTVLCSPYDSRLYHLRTPETPKSRHVDDRGFPGPLRIPVAPRFLVSPPPSPHDSPTSPFINTPRNSQKPFGSPSPPPLPSSWRESYLSERLPPIRRFYPSARDDLPHLSTARWNDDPFSLKPSPRFLETPSPTPSSPEVVPVSLPKHANSLPGSPRYEYPSKFEFPVQSYGGLGYRGDPTRLGGEPRPYRPRDCDVEADGHVNKDALRSHIPRRYSPVQDAERQHAAASGSSQRRSSLSTLQPVKEHKVPQTPHHSHASCSHREESPPGSSESRSRTKFGIRKSSRFFCTYVSPLTGERCDTWDKGWTVYATLVRHAEAEHANEELTLIARGDLGYDAAQIVTSREKKERIEENLARTGRCPDCGTVFSSRRRDSLSRHRQTSACEKAQKRGRPPTKFPKKPKGPSFQVLEVDSTGDTS